MNNSSELFQKAQQTIPGGVNSPVRAFNGVKGDPLFIEKANGAYLYDADEQEYIDYVGSWGPMILGHNHPAIKESVIQAAQHGLSFGAPTASEIDMAEKICQIIPSIEKVRMVNSGTEATMSAIRLARGYTNRNKIIKFEGCYHGHADCLLVKAGSGALTLGQPSSPGVPEDFAKHTLTATFNDLSSIQALFEQYPDDIAGVIFEPVAGNMNCIPPMEGFLEGIRTLCDQYKAVMIMDEVMTGFRVAQGGAQVHYNITPDLTCLGKVIGGGLPVGAFGGKKEIMDYIAPTGPVYQAGTLSGNPIAMAAGLTQLKLLDDKALYTRLTEKTNKLALGLQEVAKRHDIPLSINVVGGMFGFFFSDEEKVTTYEQVMACDLERFKNFHEGMLKHGIYLAPSAFEAGFISDAHSDEDIERTIQAADQVFATL